MAPTPVSPSSEAPGQIGLIDQPQVQVPPGQLVQSKEAVTETVQHTVPVESEQGVVAWPTVGTPSVTVIEPQPAVPEF